MKNNIKDIRLLQKSCQRLARFVTQDLRRMERIQTDVQWLNQRDSNCSSAASLTDSISVLIIEALRLHRAELKEIQGWARKKSKKRAM